MSQNFKFRSDELEENDITSDSRDVQNECVRYYETVAQSRNINFLLSNGEMEFLNYAYLVRGRCSIGGDRIALHFTNTTIELKGIGLKPLHYDLVFHKPMEIGPVDARYNATLDQSIPIVNEVTVIE